MVESGGAGVEAVVVVVATVKIDFQGSEIRGAGEDNGAVLVPENGIGGIAENAAENASARRAGRRTAEEAGKFFDERGTVGADRAEKLWVAEGKMQRAVASHGDARDAAIGAAGSGAIAFFDERKEFLQ